MIGYTVKCDGCGKEEDSWPDGSTFDGWAIVTFANSNRLDYCPDCWSTMFCSLITPKTPTHSEGSSGAQKPGPGE